MKPDFFPYFYLCGFESRRPSLPPVVVSITQPGKPDIKQTGLPGSWTLHHLCTSIQIVLYLRTEKTMNRGASGHRQPAVDPEVT